MTSNKFPNLKGASRTRPNFVLYLTTLFILMGSRAHADGVTLPKFGSEHNLVLMFSAGVGLLAVLWGLFLRTKLIAQEAGTPKMQEVGQAIRDGAYAYLIQQVRMMFPFVILLSIGLFFLFRSQNIYEFSVCLGVAVAFIFGVTASYISGYVGMDTAVKGNQRTAHQARTSYKGALETAFRSGAVSGLMTVGLGLLGACTIFLIFKSSAMFVLVGFGFGGSLAALFMRVGGGIFTKAADVGADLVGKVEAGIPEDDPRNPATIADNVGDNVGDCAGMAADVFESYEVTIVAAIILGATVIPNWIDNPIDSPNHAALLRSVLRLVLFPLLVQAVGIISSIVGIMSVRGAEREDLDAMQVINKGFRVSGALGSVLLFGLAAYYLRDGITVNNVTYEWWRFALCTFMGIVLALVIGRLTEYFTSAEKKPVTEIALASKAGAATMIISGFASGLESAVWGVIAIVFTLISALVIFAGEPMLAAYGVALAGLGLLMTTGYILAMDTFGPITDNANGIFEMSGVLEEDKKNPNFKKGVLSGDKIVHRLDSVGNTTKALTKGFAIATAVIAAVALFKSFVIDAKLVDAASSIGIRLDFPAVFIGLLLGGAAPFLFSSFAINAVGRSALELITEVRRQFAADSGIMAGTSKPDYARCVAIVTKSAQRELLGPGILAISLPILVGFGMGFLSSEGVEGPKMGAMALGGFLAGAIVSGQLMAVLLSNSGGAWDNAKKKIEDGWYGGKGTENHKAAVVCDTVGDPFKDTAGPALNPLIKVMNLVGILIAPIIIQPDLSPMVRGGVVFVTLTALGVAIGFSKRGSTADDPELIQEALSGPSTNMSTHSHPTTGSHQEVHHHSHNPVVPISVDGNRVSTNVDESFVAAESEEKPPSKSIWDR